MDPRVTELHCIMPMANVGSVMTHGLLSHEGAGKVPHRSVALDPVQDRRHRIWMPGGLKLHQYVNLYFHARNPMLFKRQSEVANICVLQISKDVLNVECTMLSDRNAASGGVRFVAPEHWTLLNYDAIYATDWRHPNDPSAYWKHKSQKCAEVLVPHCVEPKLITGAYVVDDAARTRLKGLGFSLPISVNPELFFKS